MRPVLSFFTTGICREGLQRTNSAILVLNAGSSSIKFSLFPAEVFPRRADILCAGEIEGVGHTLNFRAWNKARQALVNERLASSNTHEQGLSGLLEWIGV